MAQNSFAFGVIVVWTAIAALVTLQAAAMALGFFLLLVVGWPQVLFAEDSITPDSPLAVRLFMVGFALLCVVAGSAFVATGWRRIQWHRRGGRRLPKRRRAGEYDVRPVGTDSRSPRVP